MEAGNISAPAMIALGASLAALVTGFFSFLNMISAKENKVSEFRLAWIDGLRDEVAEYTVAVQELLRLENARIEGGASASEMAWLELNKDAYERAIGSLTRIQLRLNPKHLSDGAKTPEGRLIAAIRQSREQFNAQEFEAALQSSEAIRAAAAPLLKATWDQVKHGESGYRTVREVAQTLLGFGLIAVIGLAAFLFMRGVPNVGESERVRLTRPAAKELLQPGRLPPPPASAP